MGSKAGVQSISAAEAEDPGAGRDRNPRPNLGKAHPQGVVFGKWICVEKGNMCPRDWVQGGGWGFGIQGLGFRGRVDPTTSTLKLEPQTLNHTP